MDTRKLLLSALAALAVVAADHAHAEIYKWTDAAGRVHFGDQRQAGGATRVDQRAQKQQERLQVDITAHGGDLSAAGRERLALGIQRIFDTYARLFRLDIRRPVHVDIHIFPDASRLAGWIVSIDPQIDVPPAIYGVYLPKHNLVGAWTHDRDEDAVIATLLHESSHVILEQLSPRAPAWLHEGLAQYFEGIDTRADDVVVQPVADASEAIDWFVKNEKLVTLRQYFSLDEARWRHLAHVQQNPVPYTVAWSVTYFLMSRPVGRQVLNSLLQDLEKAQRAPTTQVIDQRYPGGYTMMEYDWFKWAQAEKQPQVLRW